MKRCPDLSELESFFGSAGLPVDGKGGDWFYDRLRFVHAGTEGTTTCTTLLGEQAFGLRHSRGGRVLVDVNLQHVVALDLEFSAGHQVLIGHVSAGTVEQLFKLRLHPEFSFSLTTGLPL
jgi:hypothetical protein